METIWDDKNNSTLMQSLQKVENKACKIIFDYRIHSSATDVNAEYS